MATHPRVITYLQRALAHELGAAQQYTLQAVHAAHWGRAALAAKLRADAHEELGHGEAFSMRLLALGAIPRAGTNAVPPVGASLGELLAYALATESAAVQLYREASRFCMTVGDAETAALFTRIGADEAAHAEALRRELAVLTAASA